MDNKKHIQGLSTQIFENTSISTSDVNIYQLQNKPQAFG